MEFAIAQRQRYFPLIRLCLIKCPEKRKIHCSSVHASGKQQTEARHLLKHTFARCDDERKKNWINFNELGFYASSEEIAQWMSLSESINKIYFYFFKSSTFQLVRKPHFIISILFCHSFFFVFVKILLLTCERFWYFENLKRKVMTYAIPVSYWRHEDIPFHKREPRMKPKMKCGSVWNFFLHLSQFARVIEAVTIFVVLILFLNTRWNESDIFFSHFLLMIFHARIFMLKLTFLLLQILNV